MQEKAIKERFIDDHLEEFGSLIRCTNLRLYMMEMPVRTEDGIRYADIVLEMDTEPTPMENKAFVLEFKKDKVDYQSAVAQVLRYSNDLQKQLYRKKRVTPFIVAPDFSKHELKLAKELKVIPVQYDWKTGMMRVVS